MTPIPSHPAAATRLDEIRERVESQPRDYDLETIEGRINASFDLVMADGDRAYLLDQVERLRGALELVVEGMSDFESAWLVPKVPREEQLARPVSRLRAATAAARSALGAPETREGEKP